jgi:hypothetical protein
MAKKVSKKAIRKSSDPGQEAADTDVRSKASNLRRTIETSNVMKLVL